jgi:hypothetical protein
VALNSATQTTLQELGDALDFAEAKDPALHRSRSRFENKRASRMHAYGRPWLQPNSASDLASYDLIWSPPRHRAVAAYWQALKSAIKHHAYVEDDLRTCRTRFKDAREIYQNKTAYRNQRGIEWCDGGKGVSLRAILDARAVMVEAFTILEQVEASAKYLRQIQANKRAAETDGKFKRRKPEAHARHHSRLARWSP